MTKESTCSQDVQREYQDLEIKYSLEKIKRKILIMSGKGGVGKSSIAVNIAASLASKGHKIGLLDVDLHGPSIPHMLGIPNMNDKNESNNIKNYKKGIKYFHDKIIPAHFSEYLFVVSIECFLNNNGTAVIWRGPRKIGAIRQFISDIQWGDLDYLIIDSPPGTGDEPLTVAQTIPDAEAIIVTTPQSVSVRDVKKSINFCREVHMKILGLIENMSGFICPECGTKYDLFKMGGGIKVAKEMNVVFLGQIPIIPEIVESSDEGIPAISKSENTKTLFDKILSHISSATRNKLVEKSEKEIPIPKENTMNIALPVADGMLAMHFGHCEKFMLYNVDEKKKEITNKKIISAPPHQPGLLPKWLHERGANIIIAGGMGSRAQSLFAERNIKVVIGAPAREPERIIRDYLNGELVVGENICDH